MGLWAHKLQVDVYLAKSFSGHRSTRSSWHRCSRPSLAFAAYVRPDIAALGRPWPSQHTFVL